jgi:hypothetical protein
MIEMKVAGVILDSQSKHPIVMLRDVDERRALLIWIGESEANAILMALEGIQAPRPMTHDLLNTAFEKFDVDVTRVAITEMRDQTFFAEIVCEKEGKASTIDARPSDAIALALRAGAGIFVAESVMAENAIPINPQAEEEEDKAFKEFLDNVKPGDFGKFNKD